jgi:hypothetical protein
MIEIIYIVGALVSVLLFFLVSLNFKIGNLMLILLVSFAALLWPLAWVILIVFIVRMLADD